MLQESPKETMTHPKDLGVKIGTKEEALWTQIKEESEKILREHKAEIEMRELVLKLANEHIAEEKEKFK